MLLQFDDYKKKLAGCWMGKNIGGTLGMPFEGPRKVNNVEFYTQNLGGEPAPNDDLDLQLVWLSAVERYGRAVNSQILAEYWLTQLMGNASEYGIAKANLRNGWPPPVSGYVNNVYRDSNGGWIRSEIWACLAPGHPEIAVRYAYEDAIVDHSHEGVYAEVFAAAVESAAFVETDKYKLIDIGLSYIPEGCWVAKGVKKTIEYYKAGMPWQEARVKLFTEIPGAFSKNHSRVLSDTDKDIPFADLGFDAANNMLIVILGWLYGEDDFGESLCIAVNCGEDTDCTAATLGSILGIIHGIDGIPKKWIEPLGDKIKTVYINQTEFFANNTPRTITELTDRVLKLTPVFLGSGICDFITPGNGYSIEMREGDSLYNAPVRHGALYTEYFEDMLNQAPFVASYDFVIYRAWFDYTEEPFIRPGVPKKFRLVLQNKTSQPQNLKVVWHLPEGFTVTPGPVTHAYLNHIYIEKTELEFEVLAETLNTDRYDLLVEIISEGHFVKGVIPVVLAHG